MILFLVARDYGEALAEAGRRGWAQIGYGRWVSGERDDVRMVVRFAEMPFIPGSRMVRGEGFLEHPEAGLFEGQAGVTPWLE